MLVWRVSVPRCIHIVYCHQWRVVRKNSRTRTTQFSNNYFCLKRVHFIQQKLRIFLKSVRSNEVQWLELRTQVWIQREVYTSNFLKFILNFLDNYLSFLIFKLKFFFKLGTSKIWSDSSHVHMNWIWISFRNPYYFFNKTVLRGMGRFWDHL